MAPRRQGAAGCAYCIMPCCITISTATRTRRAAYRVYTVAGLKHRAHTPPERYALSRTGRTSVEQSWTSEGNHLSASAERLDGDVLEKYSVESVRTHAPLPGEREEDKVSNDNATGRRTGRLRGLHTTRRSYTGALLRVGRAGRHTPLRAHGVSAARLFGATNTRAHPTLWRTGIIMPLALPLLLPAGLCHARRRRPRASGISGRGIG